MDVLTVLLLVAGLMVLVAGGELLVRGAGGLARALGLSPLLVGLTVVSFATSAPELAVSLDAALTDNPGLAVGNVVGSNIANVLLVLGASAVVLPMVVRNQLVRTDVPVMIVLSVLTLVLALDGTISRLDGAVLFVLLVVYVTRSVIVSRRQEARARERVAAAAVDDGVRRGGEREVRSGRRTLADLALVLVGVGLLVVGARWLVTSATSIGAALGISDLVIGLTVVAVGTSLPELATSVIAAVRGQRDLAVGNIVGSNIFNIGAVLGLTGVISPTGIPLEPGAIALDIPVMIVVAVALLPVAFTGAAVARWEGLVFLAYYAAYVAYLVLDSTGHDAVDTFSGVVVGFVLPMTVLTLAVLVAGEFRRRRARQGLPEAGAGPGADGTLST